EHLDKLISIDQSPIGRTPRSNPATYIKVFDDIRNLFAQLQESKTRGYQEGRFSFNVAGGRCEACEGNGSNKLETDFLADEWLIDLGPEGGAGGGRIVACGTPEEVAKVPESHTGAVLRAVLDPKIAAKQQAARKSASRKPKSEIIQATHIKVRGARQHNLKN